MKDTLVLCAETDSEKRFRNKPCIMFEIVKRGVQFQLLDRKLHPVPGQYLILMTKKRFEGFRQRVLNLSLQKREPWIVIEENGSRYGMREVNLRNLYKADCVEIYEDTL